MPYSRYRNRYILLVILLGIVILVATEWVCSYHHQRNERSVSNYLRSIAELKSTEMYLWHGLTYYPLERIRQNIFVQSAVQNYFLDSNTAQEEANICSYLAILPKRETIENAVLVDTTGHCVFPADNFPYLLPPAVLPYLDQSFRTRKVITTPFSFYQNDNDFIYIIAPFFAKDTTTPIAALVFEVNPKPQLDMIFNAWATFSDFVPQLYLLQEMTDSEFLVYNYSGNRIIVRMVNTNDFPFLREDKIPDLGFLSNNIEQHRAINAIAQVKNQPDWRVWISVPESKIKQFLRRDRIVIMFIAGIIYILLVIGILHFYEKIIHRRMAHELKDSYKQLNMSKHYERLIKESSDIILLVNETRRIIDVSKSATVAFGKTEEELKTHLIENIFAPEESAPMVQFIQSITETPSPLIEIKALRPNGGRYTLELSARKISDGDRYYYQIMARDISQRKDFENAIIQNETQLKSTLSAMNVGILTLDVDGMLVLANEYAEQILGMSQQDARGKFLQEIADFTLLRQEDIIENPLQLALKTHGTAATPELKLELHTHEGFVRPVSLAAVPICREDKMLTGYVLVFEDITHEENMEHQRNHVLKMQAISQLAGGIAHNFNNMLTSILGGCELLSVHRDDIPENSRQKQYIEMIRQAAIRAENLTKKLLAFSRKNIQSNAMVNIHALLNDVINDFQKENDKHVEIEKIYYDKDCLVSGNFSSLKNAIMNILTNALDAIKSNGKIVIKTGITTLDVRQAGMFAYAVDPGAYLKLTILNNGETIPSEVLPHIFEPFYTTKPVGRGAGLGLCATFNIIRDHRGIIVAESHTQETFFTIWLPLRGTVDLNATLPQLNTSDLFSANTETRNTTILIVDDEPIVRSVAEEILTTAGYHAISAENGLDGIQQLQKHPEVNAILIDLVMPVCDGNEAVPKMRQIMPDIPILIASGFDRNNEINTLIEDYHCAFIAKPYNIQNLLSAIRQSLKKETSTD